MPRLSAAVGRPAGALAAAPGDGGEGAQGGLGAGVGTGTGAGMGAGAVAGGVGDAALFAGGAGTGADGGGNPKKPEVVLRVKVPEPPPHLAALLKDRKYRWPDGSLRPEKPPFKRHVFDERRKWEDLVRYCRTTGGCQDCAKGECHLHGVGVSYVEHKAYCQALGVWNEPLERLRDEVYAMDLGSETASGNVTGVKGNTSGKGVEGAAPGKSGGARATGKSPLPQDSPLPIAF